MHLLSGLAKRRQRKLNWMWLMTNMKVHRKRANPHDWEGGFKKYKQQNNPVTKRAKGFGVHKRQQKKVTRPSPKKIGKIQW